MEARIIHGPETINSIDDVSLGQFFFNMSQKHGDKIAQVDSVTGQKESFNDVRKRSVRAAIEMSQRGITSNDIIVFCTINCLDNIIPIIGATYLGAKVASLDPTLSLSHVKHLLNLVQPTMLFVETKSVDLIEQAIGNLENYPQIVVFGESNKYPTLEDFTKSARNEDAFKPVEISSKDPAIIFFSSGTTGLPKAICLSSHSLLDSISCLNCPSMDFSSLLSFTTLYWISGTGMVLTSFLHGGYRVLSEQFDVEETFINIQKYKVTFAFTAPLLLHKLTSFKDIGNYDITSLSTLVVGGTPIGPTQLQNARKIFKNTNIINGYGLTEGGFITIFQPHRDRELMQTKLQSCGKLLSGVKIKFVNPDTGELLPPHQKGEICVKSPRVMIGYYNADSSHAFDEDGFLKTGDIGYYDEDECVYIVDRIKEMFKYQSWHIVPSVIEGVLLEHPAIVEACVFGVPDEIDGEVPAALVVLKTCMIATPEEISEFVAQRVLDREKLRAGVKIVESLPKTPSGKIIRREARALAIKSM